MSERAIAALAKGLGPILKTDDVDGLQLPQEIAAQNNTVRTLLVLTSHTDARNPIGLRSNTCSEDMVIHPFLLDAVSEARQHVQVSVRG